MRKWPLPFLATAFRPSGPQVWPMAMGYLGRLIDAGDEAGCCLFLTVKGAIS